MKTHALKLILIGALLSRAALLSAVWNSPERVFTPDSLGYRDLSDNLAASGSFERDGRAEIFRTPGYPLFLVPGVTFGASWWRIVALAQILLDVLLVYLTFLLAATLFSRRAALWAAAIQAFTPVAVSSGVRILSDSLFAMLLTLAVLLLVQHFKLRRWWLLIASALLGGAACYVRPVGMAFGGVAVVVLLGGRRFLRSAVFAGLFALCLAPWVIRNGVSGDYWGFSSVAAEAAFGYQAPAVLERTLDISMQDARSNMQMRLQYSVRGRNLSPGDLAREKRAIATDVLAEHRWEYAAVHARGDLGVWMPGATDVLEILGVTEGGKGSLEVLRRQGVIAAAKNYFSENAWAIAAAVPLVLIYAVKLLGVLLGALRCVRWRMELSCWLILAIVLVFTLIPGPAGHPRFRVPVSPLLSVAAAAGLLGLRNISRRPESNPAGR